MNTEKLREAEERFLERYPTGFDHPEFEAIRKKHKPEKMRIMAEEFFSPGEFSELSSVGERMKTFVSRTSLVSVFDKMKFRDYITQAPREDIALLAEGLREYLHGEQEKGFKMMAGALTPYKMAKWTLLSVFGVHYFPDREVLIKPTTVKKTIAHFELDVPPYSPQPSFEFYTAYREAINTMRTKVSLSFSGGNPEFQGFLMMACDF